MGGSLGKWDAEAPGRSTNPEDELNNSILSHPGQNTAALATVQATKMLNAEWRSNKCEDKASGDSVACENLKTAMLQLGFPLPGEKIRPDLPDMYLGTPMIVTEPTRLVSMEDAERKTSCVDKCGFVVGALGSALAGTVAYQSVHSSFPSVGQGVPAESAEHIRAALYTSGAILAGGAAHAACTHYCNSGAPPKVHFAPEEPFILQGVYEHEAKGLQGIEAFRSYVAKTTSHDSSTGDYR